VRDVRNLQVAFLQAEPCTQGDAAGALLAFRPERARLGVDRIEDFAELGPALTIPAVAGLGKVLRILRAARVVVPRDPLSLVGETAQVLSLLARAEGTRLLLSVRRRSRRSFVAWTEAGVEVVPDVADVIEGEDEYLVLRRGQRVPVRLPRAAVSRQQTRMERWYEVLGIERP
jgi:hypothetical protein